jgi:hypothetical protein
MVMAPMLKWSPDFLFREVPGTSTTVRFLYPSRKIALAFLLAAGLGGVVLAHLSSRLWAGRAPDPIDPVAGILFMVAMGAVALRAIWTQRVLLVDAGTRELGLLQRSPFRLRMEKLAFSEVQSIQVHDPSPSSPNSERPYHVSLLTSSGREIYLGRECRTKAIAFGHRLSGLIGIPIDRSMSGT